MVQTTEAVKQIGPFGFYVELHVDGYHVYPCEVRSVYVERDTVAVSKDSIADAVAELFARIPNPFF